MASEDRGSGEGDPQAVEDSWDALLARSGSRPEPGGDRVPDKDPSPAPRHPGQRADPLAASVSGSRRTAPRRTLRAGAMALFAPIGVLLGFCLSAILNQDTPAPTRSRAAGGASRVRAWRGGLAPVQTRARRHSQRRAGRPPAAGRAGGRAPRASRGPAHPRGRPRREGAELPTGAAGEAAPPTYPLPSEPPLPQEPAPPPREGRLLDGARSSTEFGF